MRFFLDNCLSPHQADALGALSLYDSPTHVVNHLKDVFVNRRNIPDEEWLPALSAQGEWIVVSGDLRIFKSRLLRKVWVDAKLTTFFLGKGWMNQQFWTQSWWMVRWWPEIIKVAGAVDAGSGFEVPAKPQGKFQQLRA